MGKQDIIITVLINKDFHHSTSLLMLFVR